MSRPLFVLACVLFLLAFFFVLFGVHEAKAIELFLYGGLASLAGAHAV